MVTAMAMVRAIHDALILTARVGARVRSRVVRGGVRVSLPRIGNEPPPNEAAIDRPHLDRVSLLKCPPLPNHALESDTREGGGLRVRTGVSVRPSIARNPRWKAPARRPYQG